MIERSPVYGKKFNVTLGTKGRVIAWAGALVADVFCASKHSSQASGSGAMGIARRRDAHASLVASNDFWNRFFPAFSSKALIRRPGAVCRNGRAETFGYASEVKRKNAQRCESPAVNISSPQGCQLPWITSGISNWVGTRRIAPMVVRVRTHRFCSAKVFRSVETQSLATSLKPQTSKRLLCHAK
ncbi:hypothetical protein [uncultured Roseobacter sp.]|uniref:hypothetical protein n=1 Tax=uncultured Roseobacter sp. TaxID=114847 RepID=UPI0026358C4F|nr:hypothetical protein [uncultured Roseobacter sp.]